MKVPRGNCYVTSEALFHLLGGKPAGWKPMVMRHEGDTHWFLINEKTGQRVDATAVQFRNPPSEEDYSTARGCGFLTSDPSRRARSMMVRLVYQMETAR